MQKRTTLRIGKHQELITGEDLTQTEELSLKTITKKATSFSIKVPDSDL